MTDMLRLRPFQRDAVDKIQDAHAAGMKFPVVVLPTGSGKSVVLAHLAAEHLRSVRTRVLILVHRDEIADQIISKLRVVAPHLKTGKVKAEHNDLEADVVVASVQTVSRPARLAQLVASQTDPDIYRPRAFGLIIGDEIHHVVSPSWKKVIAAFPRASKTGLTATLARGDGVGLGSVISDVVYTRSYLWMISKGYLVDPRGIEVTASALDLSGVARSGGDYQSAALGDAMIESSTGAVIAESYRQHAADRPGIVFTPSVAAAHDVAKELDKRRITAAVVDGTTAREERLAVYEGSRTGRIQVIVNCAVLTEGADFPWISCVVPRITQSAPLAQQMIGRALRPYPGKADALVLSVGGAGGKLRTLIDLEPGSVKTIRTGESLAEAVVREAEEGDRKITAGSPAFALRHRDMDLFAASASVWLRTDAGVMFTRTSDGMIVLWPGRGGTWQVRHAPQDAREWPQLHRGLSLSEAMMWGEVEAEDRDQGAGRAGSVSRKGASWRRSKAAPTTAQLDACRYQGIEVPDGATRSQVSDLLTVRTASARFDRYVSRTEPSVSAV